MKMEVYGICDRLQDICFYGFPRFFTGIYNELCAGGAPVPEDYYDIGVLEMAMFRFSGAALPYLL